MSKDDARKIFAEGWSALQVHLGGLLTSHGVTDTRPWFDEVFEKWWNEWTLKKS